MREDEFYDGIAETVAEARHDREFTLKFIYNETGIPIQMLSDFIHRRKKKLSAFRIEQLYRLLGIYL